MSSMQIQNAPKNLTMIDFRSKIDSLGSLARSCRYYVRILPAGGTGTQHPLLQLGYNYLLQDLSYMCDATEFPNRSFDVTETRYYGPASTFPYNTKYTQEISMSFLTRGDAYERQLFDDWMSIINPTNNWHFTYAKNYYANIQVFQLSQAPKNSKPPFTEPKATYMWSLRDAWPATVNAQPVTWADNDVLRLSVSFLYRYWDRPGRDATPGGSPYALPGTQQITR